MTFNILGTSKNCLLARCRRYAQILILEILLCIPAVKIYAFPDPGKIFQFSFGHESGLWLRKGN